MYCSKALNKWARHPSDPGPILSDIEILRQSLVHAVKHCNVFRQVSYSPVLLNISTDQSLVAPHAVKRHGFTVGTDLLFVRPSTKLCTQLHVKCLRAPSCDAPQVIGSSSIRINGLHGRPLHVGHNVVFRVVAVGLLHIERELAGAVL